MIENELDMDSMLDAIVTRYGSAGLYGSLYYIGLKRLVSIDPCYGTSLTEMLIMLIRLWNSIIFLELITD